jgi:hypothetical protein
VLEKMHRSEDTGSTPLARGEYLTSKPCIVLIELILCRIGSYSQERP